MVVVVFITNYDFCTASPFSINKVKEILKA